MTLTFDPEAHEYRLDGERLPSVTEVLSKTGFLRDHTGTDPFYAARGTAFHQAIALDRAGNLDEADLDPQLIPYLERARFVVEALQLEPVLVETPLCHHRFRYAGTPDEIARSKVLGRLVGIDWKTGSYESGYALQLVGGYAPLWRHAAERDELHISVLELASARYCVATLDTMPPKLRWIESHGEHESIFRAALAVHNALPTYGAKP